MRLDLVDVAVDLGGRRILWDVNLTFRGGGEAGGRPTAVLGPNGAGKTTLLRVLATVLAPTRGNLLWNGRVPRLVPYRAGLGYLPQDFAAYPHLTVGQYLIHVARMKGLGARAQAAARQALARIGEAAGPHLGDPDRFAALRPAHLSGGQLRLLGLAQALVNDPHLLVLDEPLRGLDPELRRRLSALLAGLAEDRIVILSGHGADLDHLPARWLLLDGGRVMADVDGPEWLHACQGRRWEVDLPRVAGLPLPPCYHVISARDLPGGGRRLRLLTPPAVGPAQLCAALGLPPASRAAGRVPGILRARSLPVDAEQAYLCLLHDCGCRPRRPGGPTSDRRRLHRGMAHLRRRRGTSRRPAP